MCEHENLVDATSFDEASRNAKAMICGDCGMNFIVPVKYEINLINDTLEQVKVYVDGLKKVTHNADQPE